MNHRSIVFVFSFVFFSVATAGTFECKVTGYFDSDPSPGHPKGSGTLHYVGRDRSETAAKQSAFSQCEESGTRCEFISCRIFQRLAPKPLTPDTQVSCSDDSGLQIEIFSSPTCSHFFTIISQNELTVATFEVQATVWGDSPRAVAYSSLSQNYSMELDMRYPRFYVNGRHLFSHGEIQCIP